MTNNLPAKQEPPRTLIEMVRSMQGQIMQAIAGYSDKERERRAERFARIVVTALQQNEKLRACTTESFLGSMMTCVQLDLEPNTPQQLAHLIPYKNNKTAVYECQFQVGYPGLMELAYRTGQVSRFHADVVYEEELKAGLFEYSKGFEPTITHKVDLLKDVRRDKIVAAYAVAKMKDGTYTFRLVDAQDIARAKKSSASLSGARSEYSPWNTAPDSMCMKTAIKRLCMFLPRTEQLLTAIELDDKAERGEPSWLPPAVDPTPALDLNGALLQEPIDVKPEEEAITPKPPKDLKSVKEEAHSSTANDVTRPTREAVEAELKRLGGGNSLPPDLAAIYQTGDPSELTEREGLDVLKALKSMKA